jgi:hypothetical protein
MTKYFKGLQVSDISEAANYFVPKGDPLLFPRGLIRNTEAFKALRTQCQANYTFPTDSAPTGMTGACPSNSHLQHILAVDTAQENYLRYL